MFVGEFPALSNRALVSVTALSLTTILHAFDMRLAERAGGVERARTTVRAEFRVPVIHSAMLQKSDTPPDVLASCERNRRLTWSLG